MSELICVGDIREGTRLYGNGVECPIRFEAVEMKKGLVVCEVFKDEKETGEFNRLKTRERITPRQFLACNMVRLPKRKSSGVVLYQGREEA